MWIFHVVMLPGWLAVRPPVSLRAGTFGSFGGSTRTGKHRVCKNLALVPHMAILTMYYGGDERKLYRLMLSQAQRQKCI